MNLMTGGVVSGLIGAASQMKLAGVSMRVYTEESKKLHPDAEKMNRALGYASNSMKEAMKEKEKCLKEMEKAQIEAREEEKVEREAELQKVKNTKIETKVSKVDKTGNNVEISQSGKSAATGDNVVKAGTIENVQVNVQKNDGNINENVTQVYLPSGGVKVVVSQIEHKISVKT